MWVRNQGVSAVSCGAAVSLVPCSIWYVVRVAAVAGSPDTQMVTVAAAATGWRFSYAIKILFQFASHRGAVKTNPKTVRFARIQVLTEQPLYARQNKFPMSLYFMYLTKCLATK